MRFDFGCHYARITMIWLLLFSCGHIFAQVDENCTISVLNRNAAVQADGGWIVTNIPVGFGRVRARATCVQNGVTQMGQSDLFTITTNVVTGFNASIVLGNVTPIPISLNLTSLLSTLTQAGQTAQLSVVATLPDGSTKNITSNASGTDYTISNPAVATISPDGLVQAVSNGSVVITAFNEGTSAAIVLRIGIPPTAAITSPANGAAFTEGATVPVTVSTTGSVAFVSLFMNNQVISTTNRAPYLFSLTVPLGSSSVTLGAEADDGQGDIGTAPGILLNVNRDPLTTVVGGVIDNSGAAVSGASVATNVGPTTTSGPDGSFSIPGIRTTLGDLSASATFTRPNGQVLAGSSQAFPPVPGGTTDLGTFAIRPFLLKVLVSSGEINAFTEQFTDTAELYDPGTGQWTLTANHIPNAPPASGLSFCGANMALLGNGKALFAGGGCSDAAVTTEAASLYDPATNRWTATAGMTFGRDQFAMVTLNNGNAMAIDGCAGGCVGPNRLFQFVFQVGQSTEIYDQNTNLWSTAGSTTSLRANLALENFLQPAVTLPDGKVLICSGGNGFTGGTSSCELYDPFLDVWSETGDMGDPGIRQFVVLSNGKVLNVNLDGISVQLWDEASGLWNSTGSLHTPHVRGAAVLLNNGEILLSGGNDGANAVQTVEIYNPTSGAWRTTSPMSVPRQGHIAVKLADGRVLVAGGFDAGLVTLSSAEIFDPATGTWSPTGSMSQPRAFANAVAIPF